jgi:transposase
VLNALILLACDEGGFQSQRSINEDIARVLGVSMKKIDRLKKRFVEEGLDSLSSRRLHESAHAITATRRTP